MGKLAVEVRSEVAATAVEYGIMLALIAIVIVAAVFTMGLTLGDDYGCAEAYVSQVPASNPATITC